MLFYASQLNAIAKWRSELQIAFWLLLTSHWHRPYKGMLSVHPT